MKKGFISIVAVMLCAAVAHSAGIGWAKAYSKAKSASKASGKLIMIDFYTDWCGWCKKLDADTYPAPAVVKQSTQFVPIKLNAEKDADGIRLAKKFGVTGYPTIIFMDANENLNYKIVGYAQPKEFAESMAKAAAVPKDLAKFTAILKKSPKDPDATLGLASVYATTGQTDRAAKMVESVKGGSKSKVLDAYNAVGDGYQAESKFEQAVPYFEMAIDPAFPKQAAYARISIASCYFESQQPKQAIPVLEALLKMGKEADEFRAQAKQMLEQAKKG